MKFGENLRNLRKSKNITQEELSEKVNVSRQSVSKWETGEAYPEMNNILELCKIFHCNINDLVNDNMIDLDSLDEDVVMSVVKFKKEKQKQMKGISNILSLIGKISSIVLRVGVVFIILAMVFIPIAFTSVDIKDGKIISKNNSVKVVEYGSNTDIRINNSNIVSAIDNNDIIKVSDAIEKYSKSGIIMLFEFGFGILTAFIIVLIKALKHLELLFSNISKGDTPFTLDNVSHIKKMAYLLIVSIILSTLGASILNIPMHQDFDMDINLFNIVEILFLYSMSLIFEYGYEIQLDSKGRIYGDENE